MSIMKCPRCQHIVEARIIDSRGKVAGGGIRRRRICARCRKRFSTIEIPISEHDELSKRAAKCDRARELLCAETSTY
ncbi:MAG: hypothetical protein ACR2QC_01455 [Gammaproteobacteria bacterium]